MFYAALVAQKSDDKQNNNYYCYLVGSSKNMTGGLLTSSSAMESLFRWPPDKLPVRVSLASSNDRLSRTLSTCNAAARTHLTEAFTEIIN